MKRAAADWIGLIADSATFEAWDTDVVSTDPLAFRDTRPYTERLRDAAQRSGETEAVVTGRARIGGVDVVLVVGEFGFLAGTKGVATAERVVRAFERATLDRLPVVALPVSGGTRMQEGTAAFIQMASCAAAVRRHRDAGLLYVAYLRHPTTGGVLGSWASLAHVTWATPGALLGLTGPRVVAQLTGEELPPHVQTAENLQSHGVVDDVVAPEELRARLAAVLQLVASGGTDWEAHAVHDIGAPEVAAWDAVEHSRRPDRPGVREVLEACGVDLAGPVAEVRGDGAGEDDPGCRVLLVRVCGTTSVVVAQDRPRGQRGASMGASGYRKARRGMLLAQALGVPLITCIDTAGAAMTPHDEEGGLAATVAACLAELAALRVPTLSLLLGEGTGGGAIALLPADRVAAFAHAWLSPIAPEGASVILHRTAEHAPAVAAAQGITAADLHRLGIVDCVVADRDAHTAARMANVVHREIAALLRADPDERLTARRHRYRTIAR